MKTHTSGNWNYSKHGNNDSFGIYAENNPRDLAIVVGGNEEGGEGEANAKLIAASPLLLKVAQSVVNHFMMVSNTEDRLFEAWETNLWQEAEDAINYATL